MKADASTRIRKVAMAAMLAAIAVVLNYFEMPLPLMPPFLKIDASTIPILIGSFILGPIYAVGMAFVKNFVHFFTSTSGGVGQIADFIITSAFTATAAIVYRRNRTKKGAIMACVTGCLSIMVAGYLANRYLLIPFYSQIMPIEAIFSACAKVNPLIHDLDSYLLFGAMPFNFIKGTLISLVTFPVYKKLSSHIRRFISDFERKAAMAEGNSLLDKTGKS